MTIEEAIEEFSFFYEGDYITRNMSEAKDIVLDELDSKDTEINKLKKQLQNISDEFLKYDWQNATQEQVYNQLKSLYESIFMKEDK